MVISNLTFIVIVVASSLRFLGGYSIGFWAVKFFSGMFPDDSHSYSIANMLICSILGMSAAYLGGFIGDRFEPKWPVTKGMLDAICSLLAFPFIFFSYWVPKEFWTSIGLYACSYFFSEMWYGACVSMLLTIFPS